MPTLIRTTFSPADTEAHIALARKVYAGPATTDPAHWRWKHALSPFGASLVSSLIHSSGEMVGRTISTDRPFLMDGATLRGRTIMDFVIDPEFRRADTTIRLIRAGASMEDCDVILHGSNEMSDPLYRRLFRYPVVGALSAAAFPLRVRGLLRRLLKRPPLWLDRLAAPWRWSCRGLGALAGALARVKLVEEWPEENELSLLLARFARDAGPHFLKTPAFLAWRFREGPLFNARLLAIRSRGRLAGYIAVRRFPVDGFEFEVIVDFAHDHTLSPAQRLAVRLALIGQSAATSADGIFVIANFANPTIRDTLGAPLIPIPDRFLKHPSPIFAHVREPRENRLKALGQTFMTLADIDYL